MNQWTRSPHSRRPLTLTFYMAAGLLAVAFLFGGASRLHAVPLAIVELAAVPLLLWSAMRLIEQGGWREIRVPTFLILLTALIPLLQLMPLPAGVWRDLPGREAAARVAILSGVGDATRAYSLAPRETFNALLALLPPVAMFLATVRLGSRERLILAGLVVVAIGVNLSIGVAQLAVGDAAYPYVVSSKGFAVGLFTNRNHYSILLVCGLPIATVLLLAFAGRRHNPRVLTAVATLIFLLLVVIGAIMGRSRAAIGLIAPALVMAVLIIARAEGRVSKRMTYWVAGVGLLAVGIAIAFGLQPLLARLSEDALSDIRFAAAPEIFRQSFNYLPFGSGIGSFEQVYQSFEPLGLLGAEFLNHAHDDYLELFLEAGYAAVAVLLLFLAWWGWSIRSALRADGPYSDLALAGASVTAILMLHSIVDYPLRTPALATLFAFSCGLLATPEPIGRRRETASQVLRAGT